MHMGVTVSVISGKGGTGKTTLCAGIAACLAAEGKRVLCIDADIGLRNLDIALGMAEQPAVAFTDVTQGFCKLSDAAEHPALPGLFLLTAPVREQDALVEQQRFGALLREAREAFDWVLIDAAAGIGTSFRLATQFATAASSLPRRIPPPCGTPPARQTPLRSRGTSFCSSWSTACSRACFRA